MSENICVESLRDEEETGKPTRRPLFPDGVAIEEQTAQALSPQTALMQAREARGMNVYLYENGGRLLPIYQLLTCDSSAPTLSITCACGRLF